MNADDICNEIIKQIDLSDWKTEISDIKESVDIIRDEQAREHTVLGFIFIAILTMTTNLWAQHVYNNYITNFGRGTHYGTDSLVMMAVFSVIAIGVTIIFANNLI